MRYILIFFATFFLITQSLTAQNLQLDPSFHHDGFTVTDFGKGSDGAAGIALLPDGKFLLGSTAWNGGPNFAIARFHADGSPDMSFGSGGHAHTGIPGELVFIQALPDGKILLAGSANYANDLALARCLANGSTDTTFGDKGRVIFHYGDNYAHKLTAATVQPDGKILFTASSDNPYAADNQGFALFRFTPEGTPDTTFGTAGITAIDPVSGHNRATAITLQAGGKIVVAGMRDTLNDDIMLFRFNPDGQLDTTFGEGGITRTNLFHPNDDYPYHSTDYASAVLVQPDSAIVVIGHSYHGFGFQHMVAVWYTPDGLFNQFRIAAAGGIGGPPSSVREEGWAAARMPDGRIVAAGNFWEFDNDNGWVSSFFVSSFDPTPNQVNDNIFKIIDIGDESGAYAVAVLPDSSILVAGEAALKFDQYGKTRDMAMIRLTGAGLPDIEFGAEGIAVTGVGTNTDRATDVTILEDGKILVGAVIDTVFYYSPPVKPETQAAAKPDPYATALMNYPNFSVARYLENGDLDTAFGEKGRAGFTINEADISYVDYYYPYYDPYAPVKTAIGLRPNGNILVTGSREFDFGIAEFLPTGKQFVGYFLVAGDTIILPRVRRIDFDNGNDVATTILMDTALSLPFAEYPTYTVAGYSSDQAAVAWCCTQYIDGLVPRKITVDIGPGPDYATAVGYQYDSTLIYKKLTVAGGYHVAYNSLPRLFLMRLKIENDYAFALDTTFGDAGIFQAAAGDSTDLINAFLIQEDNSIIAAGAVDDQMAVFRFLPDGGFDASFGSHGVVKIPAGSVAQDLAIQPNGRIVATGYSADKIVTARLLPNGQPDPTFGINGVLVTNLRGKKDLGMAIALQEDGKIVVAGSSDNPYAGTDIAVLRYKPNSGIPPLGASAAVVGVSCPDNSDGQAAVTATGGFPPYTYKWNTGQTTSSLAGLSAAAYTVTVTDSVQVKFVLTVDVPVLPDTMAPSIFCPGNMITQSCTTAVQYELPLVADNCGADVPELISGLPPGSVFPEGVTVVVYQTADAAGNTAVCQFEIEVRNTLELTTDAEPGCPGELNLLTASALGGTPPYSYVWSSGNNGPLVLTALSGLFTVTLTDALGCTRSEIAFVQSIPPMEISAAVTPAWIDSANGGISAAVSGGEPPYTYNWYRAGQPAGTGPVLLNIPGGEYTLIVTDAAGCMNMTLWTVPEVVATAEPANVLQCRVFPNPFTEKLQLQLTLRHSAEVRWRICDLTGRCYDEHSAGYTGYLQTELQTGDLPAGMYLLYIRIGSDMVQRKVVKVIRD